MNTTITAQRLLHLRQQAELTQAKLGEAILYSTRAVISWEKAIKLPSFDAIIALSRFYGVTSDYILGLTDKE